MTIGDVNYNIFILGPDRYVRSNYAAVLRKSTLKSDTPSKWDFEDLWTHNCDTIEEARKAAVEYYTAHKAEYDRLVVFDRVAFNEEKPDNTQYRSTIICPYCGADNGAPEEHYSDEWRCDECNKDFPVEQDITVTYSTRKKKEDIRGIYLDSRDEKKEGRSA